MEIKLALVTAFNAKGSSQIKAIGYVPETQTLFLEFHPAKTKPNVRSLYSYSSVPRELFLRLIYAESIGTRFGQDLKRAADDHPFTRLSPEIVEDHGFSYYTDEDLPSIYPKVSEMIPVQIQAEPEKATA